MSSAGCNAYDSIRPKRVGLQDRQTRAKSGQYVGVDLKNSCKEFYIKLPFRRTIRERTFVPQKVEGHRFICFPFYRLTKNIEIQGNPLTEPVGGSVPACPHALLQTN